MRLKLISCEVLFREMCHAAAHSPHQVDVEFLPKGLHDIGAKGMCARLQEAVDRVEPGRYDAILLGYALCNNGITGLTARHTALVAPRAHDCITLFLGSRERYLTYFNANPGVYFKTSGWIERGESPGELSQLSIQRQTGMDSTYDDLVAKYGEDNAKYLWDTLCEQTRNYTKFAYIEMGVEPDDRFERATRDEAAGRGWQFERMQGDMGLIRRLVDGEWDGRDFLTVAPGNEIAATYGDEVLEARPAAGT